MSLRRHVRDGHYKTVKDLQKFLQEHVPPPRKTYVRLLPPQRMPKDALARCSWIPKRSYGLPGRCFLIEICYDQDPEMLKECLLHEWAHALVFLEQDRLSRKSKRARERIEALQRHDKLWGIAVAKCYAAYMVFDNFHDPSTLKYL